MEKHAPGPWRLETYFDDGESSTHRVEICGVYASDGTPIVSDDYGCSKENLLLIAAAPELLSALKDVFKMMDEGMLCRDISKDHLPGFAGMAMGLVTRLKFADDAIKKAEGRNE